MRRVLARRTVFATTALATLAVVSAALAYFTTTGAGSASGTVATLSPPGSPSAGASGTTATITWNASTISGSVAASSYTVERYSSGGVDLGPASCSPVPSSSGSPGAFGSFTCNDHPPGGTYEYQITAHYHSSWSTSSGFTNVVGVQYSTSTTAGAPTTGNTGAAIPASLITSSLSGASSGAGGTITFKVFGPQSSAPAGCTSGGTTVGTASVSGNGTYSASAGYTPPSAGTYWWYASYGGDSNDTPSSSTCGSGMTSTVVKNATAITASAPASGTTGTAIAASSISSALSGATGGAGGTITFTVFGPQSTAPTTCTSGGTTVATATVSGAGTYNPSAGFTASSAGTYWWYASYNGDSSNGSSTSTCGSGMASTVVKNTTTLTASEPVTDTSGTAISASSIKSTLSGATSGAGGTITYTVFGPQSTAPSSCASGGSTVGTATVSGNGTYTSTAGFTPSSAGTYWWYASYSGDIGNTASGSGCGAGMGATVVYSVTSVASGSASGSTSASTSTFAIQPNTSYLLLISRASASGDSVSSFGSSSLIPALSTSSFTQAAAQTYNSNADWQWAYYFTSSASASGTGTITVNFSKSGSTYLDLVALGGAGTATPVITGNVGQANGSGASATANLPSAPASVDAGVVLVGTPGDLGAGTPTATPSMTSLAYQHSASGTQAVFTAVPSNQNETVTISSSTWASLALEISAPQGANGNTTTTTASGPSSGTAGTAVSTGSIAATLSGATSGAGGTMTFTVFGPQASAPTSCTSGGTAIGIASVTGNGTYHPSSAFTPSSAGTYWWYVSYSGDVSSNRSSASACGSAMSSTVVGPATPTVTVGAPGATTASTALSASSITSTMSGAVGGAGGTITYKVFGPQASAPTTCTSGGTTVGTSAVSGGGTYTSSAGFTPSSAGTYWWYASYGGDSNDLAANSGCGSGMTATYVYSASSVASSTATTGSSIATSSFTVAPSTTYLLLVYETANSINSVSSISSTGLSPALSTASFTSITSESYNAGNDNAWAYWITTSPSASGTGTIGVQFNHSLSGNSKQAVIDLVQLGGASPTAPVVTGNVATATGSSTSATSALPNSPSTSDLGLVFLDGENDLGTSAPTASPAMTNIFFASGYAALYTVTPASSSSYSFPISGTGGVWGTIGLELTHP